LGIERTFSNLARKGVDKLLDAPPSVDAGLLQPLAVDERHLLYAFGVSLCRANTAHIRLSRPDSGLGLQVVVLETF